MASYERDRFVVKPASWLPAPGNLARCPHGHKIPNLSDPHAARDASEEFIGTLNAAETDSCGYHLNVALAAQIAVEAFRENEPIITEDDMVAIALRL